MKAGKSIYIYICIHVYYSVCIIIIIYYKIIFYIWNILFGFFSQNDELKIGVNFLLVSAHIILNKHTHTHTLTH